MRDHDGALHAPGIAGLDGAVLVAPLAVLVAYVLAARGVARGAGGNGRPWLHRRTASFAAGVGLLLLGLQPPVSTWAHAGFAGHALQHLLIGMLAPIGLVLGAPVTLLLRSLPRRTGQRIGRVLRSGPVHLLTRPATALTLSAGGLWLIYLTPLYDASTRSPFLHAVIHVHVVLAGCLFAWVIAGPDPAPHRPSVTARLVALGCAIGSHAALSQLLYADVLVAVDAPIDQLRAGATLMYYGGDAAELLLAIALLVTWRPSRRVRRLRDRHAVPATSVGLRPSSTPERTPAVRAGDGW